MRELIRASLLRRQASRGHASRYAAGEPNGKPEKNAALNGKVCVPSAVFLACRHRRLACRASAARLPAACLPNGLAPCPYASLPGQFPLICIASISAVFFALSMSFTLMRMNSSALPLSL
jgi:hypothetical protein